MALLEPERELASLPQRVPRRMPVPALIIAGMLAAGLAIGALAVGSAADPALSASQQQGRFAAFSSHGALTLPAVAPVDRDRALDGMQLAPAIRAGLAQEFDRQRLDLVWLTLWDDQAEDGDIVQVESHGFTQQVTLRHTPVQVAIPRAPGGLVLIRGIYDGGGGITVAAASRGATVPLPVMAPGQVIGLAITP